MSFYRELASVYQVACIIQLHFQGNAMHFISNIWQLSPITLNIAIWVKVDVHSLFDTERRFSFVKTIGCSSITHSTAPHCCNNNYITTLPCNKETKNGNEVKVENSTRSLTIEAIASYVSNLTFKRKWVQLRKFK